MPNFIVFFIGFIFFFQSCIQSEISKKENFSLNRSSTAFDKIDAIYQGASLTFNPSPDFYKADKVGQGKLRVMFFNIYDIALYSPQGFFRKGKPLVLYITYLRPLSAEKILEYSLKEIRKQGFENQTKLKIWEKELKTIFRPVYQGTVLIGVLTVKGETIFYYNGEWLGSIQDKEFGSCFFDIWLGDKTSVPQLRKELIHHD